MILWVLRAIGIAAYAGVCFAADVTLTPMTVCEVLRDLPAHEGKDIAILGRYSFRAAGTWIGEQSCQPAISTPATLSLVENGEAPKLPESYTLDAIVLHRKLTGVLRHTSLGKFRFGTPDYDRWAVIYGRVEKRPSGPTLVFRGSGVVVMLSGEE